jgi:hypothetical protein
MDYYEPVETNGQKRPSRLFLILLPVVAFLMGIAAMAWLLGNWDGAARLFGIVPGPAPVAEAPVVPQPEAPAPSAPPTNGAEPQRLLIDPEMTRRVSQLERQLVEIDQQSRAAVGNADRAEGLLVAFAARRALDRGVSLGYLEGLLRQRFGDSQPQAVATIITASRQPVTLQDLQEELQEVGPQLTGAGPDESWWSALQTELRALVTVRRQGTPSTLPVERLRRVTRRLEAGQVDVALAEVLRLPGHENASEWIDAARRYVAARRALDRIETAALLDPRTMPPPEGAPGAEGRPQPPA